jgi:hypothetical protein
MLFTSVMSGVIVSTAAGSAGFTLDIVNGHLRWTAAGNQVTDTGPSIGPNAWHHIAVAAVSGALDMWVDGASVLTGGVSANWTTDAAVRIGKTVGTNPDYLNGSISDLAIYTRRFTAADVAEIYSGGTRCH